MSFFEELQANYEKAMEAKKEARKKWAEKEAEELLLPILEKHFRRRQEENPNASVISITVIALEGRHIKIEATQNDYNQSNKTYFEHSIGKFKGHDSREEEKDLTSREICEALCRIANNLYPQFNGNRKQEKEYAFEFTLRFILPSKG